ncbi:hypothetical protein DFH06DRAFT_1142353 [Mycena polygramma]|nr:hypothetical protein DFH06DRAFT_1142353 [Mycena polygramma]
MFKAARTKTLPADLLARIKTLPFTLKEPRMEDAVWDEINRTSDAERTDILRWAKLYVAEGYLAAMRGRESALAHFENIQKAVCTQPVYNALLSRGHLELSTVSPAVRTDTFLFFIFALRRSLEPADFFTHFASIFVPLIEVAEAFLEPQFAVHLRPIKKVKKTPVKYTHAALCLSTSCSSSTLGGYHPQYGRHHSGLRHLTTIRELQATSAFKSITRSFYAFFAPRLNPPPTPMRRPSSSPTPTPSPSTVPSSTPPSVSLSFTIPPAPPASTAPPLPPRPAPVRRLSSSPTPTPSPSRVSRSLSPSTPPSALSYTVPPAPPAPTTFLLPPRPAVLRKLRISSAPPASSINNDNYSRFPRRPDSSRQT